MKNLSHLILLLALALTTNAQGIIGATKQPSKANAQQELKQELSTDEGSAILKELGIEDEDTHATPRPRKPAFQIPDTTFEIGWLPERTSRLLNDYTGILTPGQADSIEAKLLQCYDSCKVEIAVVIVPDLGGDAVESFAQNLWDEWHIGNKEMDNGVLLIVKPKNSTSGQVRIQTGYGMEGALPDAFCKRIIEDQMIPHFQENEYFEAIDAALNIIIPVAKGEYSLDQYKKDHNGSGGIIVLIILIIIFIAIIKSPSSSTGSFTGSSWSGGSSSWSSGGGSSWSSSSGGGFGGFGGGSSGGGGASGRW